MQWKLIMAHNLMELSVTIEKNHNRRNERQIVTMYLTLRIKDKS